MTPDNRLTPEQNQLLEQLDQWLKDASQEERDAHFESVRNVGINGPVAFMGEPKSDCTHQVDLPPYLISFSSNEDLKFIPHNKRTMVRTQIMYGVTMEEKGISRVLPVDLVNLNLG